MIGKKKTNMIEESQNTVEKQLAGFGVRLIAYLTEFAFGFTVFALVLRYIVIADDLKTVLDRFLTGLIVLIFIHPILTLVNIALTVNFGGGLGKLLCGLKIVDQDSRYLSYKKAFFRLLVGYQVAKLVSGLGFIWIMVDKQKRGWHDLVTGSWVVFRSRFAWIVGVFTLAAIVALNVFLGQKIYYGFKNNLEFYREVIEQIEEEFEFDDQLELEESPAIPANYPEPIEFEV